MSNSALLTSIHGKQRFSARWVFPIDADPIENGIIETQDGTIVSIARRVGMVDSKTIDLGNTAVLPGFINCHSHLEFSDLKEPLAPALPFASWIGRVVAHRRCRTASLADLINAGACEVNNTGTVAVGEIATGTWSPGLIKPELSSTLSIVAFREVLCFLPEQIESAQLAVEEHIQTCSTGDLGQDSVIAGISPHSPYTVIPEMTDWLINYAIRHQVPLCMHLAETEAEREFLLSGTGELREMLDRIGLWRHGLHPTGRQPLDILQSLKHVCRGVLAHCNYLSESERQFLAKNPHLTVAYCPRTHRYFNHSTHPWADLIERGASVALGTDGRSSNPDYSLWNELRYLDRIASSQDRKLLLELATSRGARALGLAQSHGTLSPGKRAAFCTIALANPDSANPYTSLFGSN